MSFSSRRRNYLLTPHRRDGLIEFMKSMLTHSFVLNALDSTGADTFSHFEMLIEEHRAMECLDTELNQSTNNTTKPSRLRQLVPTVGTFHTRLPLRSAFEAYNAKYGVTARKHVCISFNEIRHILNLAQIMALNRADGGRSLDISEHKFAHDDNNDEEDNGSNDEYEKAAKRWSAADDSPSLLFLKHDHVEIPELNLDDSISKVNLNDTSTPQESKTEVPPVILPQINENPNQIKFKGPKMISFDGDQTLYSDGANFESNPKLASYLYLLLRHGVTVAVVTAAGYEYQTMKYELRLSGLLAFFKQKGLPKEDCERFFLFGGECNYLLRLGSDYKLHAVKEYGAGGWMTSTKFLSEAPANWSSSAVKQVLDISEECFVNSVSNQSLNARIIRKKRAIGLVPKIDEQIPREALDETVLRVQEELERNAVGLPYCAFNGGSDAWVDVGNKRVGVQILQSYLGIEVAETLHIGDQFLNTGNDYAARDVCPCVWITSPTETTYILKSILRLAGVSLSMKSEPSEMLGGSEIASVGKEMEMKVNFDELDRRSNAVQLMDVYTGEIRATKK